MAYAPPVGIPSTEFGIDEVAPAHPAEWPESQKANFYYIDNTHPSATDTANTYGYPDLPRLTIPQIITLVAGSIVEIHGGPYEIDQTTYAYRISSHATTPPTEANPAFVSGIGNPLWKQTDAAVAAEFTSARLELGVSPGSPLVWTIIEGIEFRHFTVGVTGNGSHHVCIRNCESSAQFGNNRSVMSVSPPANGIVHDIVFYNVHLHHTADWNNVVDDFDQHGIAISTITRSAPTELYNVWVLDSNIHNVSGDSVQITGGTNGHSIMHHIYIGRNTAYENRQSGFWCKEASDVVISQNVAHTMNIIGTGLSNYGFGSQYGPNRLWFLFNEAYGVGTGFGQSDSTGAVDTYDEYYIGNYIHDLERHNPSYSNWGRGMGWAFQFTQGVVHRHVIDNTAVNVIGGIFCHNAGDVTFRGNIIENLQPYSVGNYEKHIDFDFTAGVSLTNSIIHGIENGTAGQIKMNMNGSSYTTLVGAQAGGWLTSSFDSDPLLTNGRPASNSPAVGANTESDVYDTFFGLYGLNIKVDVASQSRPQGGSWDIGAYEYINLSYRPRQFKLQHNILRRSR